MEDKKGEPAEYHLVQITTSSYAAHMAHGDEETVLDEFGNPLPCE